MRRRTVLFFVLTCLLLLGTVPAQAQFGKIGKILDKAKKFSDLEITEKDEIALGKAISDRICAQYGVQQDLEATRYLTMVGLVVAQKSSRPNLPYTFIILDSNMMNAFAAPGGYIHMTRGALAAMKDEAELAGVLGHEIAHVTEKHTIKGLQKMKGIELAEGQTSLTGNAEVFNRIADKASDAIMKGFGRAEELDSDKVGIRFSAATGYAPAGLQGFLNTLKAQNQGASSKAGLFSSHPETQERIDKLQAQISAEKLSAQATAVLAERLHQWIKYELQKPTASEAAVEGARGLAGGEKKDANKTDAKKEDEKKEEKKKGGWMSRMKNPLGKGDKQESAEVTGAGASRGVGEEGKEDPSGKPKNPTPLTVQVSAEELSKFRAEGKLK